MDATFQEAAQLALSLDNEPADYIPDTITLSVSWGGRRVSVGGHTHIADLAPNPQAPTQTAKKSSGCC